LSAGIASAQTITISPLRANLSAREPVATVTLRNEDPTRPTLIQARPSAWAVVDGDDRYDPTRELVVSPAIFRLEPGQTQVIRLTLRGEADPRSERLFRLFLQQLPDDGASERGASNVRFLVTFSIPVIVAPSGNPDAAPHLAWSIERDPAGEHRLRVVNDGTAHRKIVGVALSGASGDRPIVSAPTYLLPNTERVWGFRLEGPLPAGKVDLTVLADDGTSSRVQAARAE
jgi:fimbrial chaperone protein